MNAVPTKWLLAAFVLAIAAANASVSLFAASALPFTAFLLIPFDLVVRDVLHERWKGQRLALRMLALILMGGAISSCFSGNLQIAAASSIAFVCAGIADWIIYSTLYRSIRVRMVASNTAGAMVDSLLFPVIALGFVDWTIVSVQTVTKFAGSLLWVWLLSSVLQTVKRSRP